MSTGRAYLRGVEFGEILYTLLVQNNRKKTKTRWSQVCMVFLIFYILNLSLTSATYLLKLSIESKGGSNLHVIIKLYYVENKRRRSADAKTNSVC